MLFYVKKILSFSIVSFLIFSSLSFSSLASNYIEEAENRKFLEVESNLYPNWPIGPSIGAQAAILMDANNGAILYAKNIHEKLYPASITKLLTTYIAMQECKLTEPITFSEEAISSINWWEDANMAVNPYTTLPLKDVLSGILIGSANEAAYAVAEHISGDVSSFSQLMNKTASDLGCINSHFVTPNGIHDENHYTTAYDMALIAKAFFSDETLSTLSGTLSYTVPVNSTQKKEGITLTAKSQLLEGKPYAYNSLIGTKTGYTDSARQTLVSCAEKNGMKLICVILKEEAPFQFSDTVELFDYGFDNFSPIYLSETDNPFSVQNKFFTTSYDILGNSKAILSLNEDDYVILPNTLSFSDLSYDISYDNKDTQVCSIQYNYRSHPLGLISVQLAENDSYIFDFSTAKQSKDLSYSSENEHLLFINIFHIISIIILIFLCLIFLLFLKPFFFKAKFKNLQPRRSYKRRYAKKRFLGKK